MKTCKIVLGSFLSWFVIMSFIFMLYSFPGGSLPSSSADYNGREKEINLDDDRTNGREPISCFSYGPYKSLKKGQYLIAIFYQAEADTNVFDVHDGTSGEILASGSLGAESAMKFVIVDLEEDGKLEVRTSYGGAGSYYLKCISIIPVSTGILAFLFMMIVMVCLAKYLLVQDIDLSYVFLAGEACAALVFFLEPTNFRLGAVLLYVFLTYEMLRHRKRHFENKLAVSLLSIALTCFLNLQYYDFAQGYAEVYEFLLCMLFCCFVWLIGKQGTGSEILIEIFTGAILFYQAAQNIYYSFFKSFFRLRAVLLLRTASGAGKSIAELVSQYQAQCYLAVLVLYISACIISHVRLNPRRDNAIMLQNC